ncbi:MAG: PAS domain S-box protein [Desulfobulbaceae bacterium]|nr:PAS domain S-box protein [Desulfobulbaceae bacterium]
MKLSIRWVIIFSAIALVWGTHLIITPSSYFMSEKILSEHMTDIMENISDLTLEESYNHLRQARNAVSFARLLLNSGVISSDVDSLSSLERYFFDQLSIFPYFSGIYFGGVDGNFIMVSRDAGLNPEGFHTKIISNSTRDRKVEVILRDRAFREIERRMEPGDTFDPRTRPWFKPVFEQKQVAWSKPYIFYTIRKPGVTIAAPCLHEDGSISGIVGLDIEISELSTFMNEIRIGKSGKAFIINRNGDMIAFHDLSKLMVLSENRNDLRLTRADEIDDIFTRKAFTSIEWSRDESNNIQLQNPVFSSLTYKGKKYRSMFSPFPDEWLPWIIGVYLPEDDYLGTLKSNRTLNIIATIIISLIASCIGLYFARKIISPVESLALEAKAIEKKNMNATSAITSKFNELQEAADAFARMKAALISSEAKLHESESLYKAIARNVNDAIIMMDHDHCISFLNPAAERMFSYSENQVRGMKLHRLLAPKRDIPLYEQGLARFSMTGKGPFINRTVNVTAIDKFGMELPVEMSLAGLQLDGRWHAVATIRNITERKKAEQLRKRLADDLHDGLGGSLTNIKLFAEMTKTQHNEKNTQKNLAAIAEISEDCLLEIRNYMNVLDDFEMHWEILVSELKQYCFKTLEPHNIKFSMTSDIDPEAPPPTRLLFIDLQKIVKEAVTNVIKHSNGDSIHIEVRVTRDRLLCFIADNGTVGQAAKSRGRGLLSMTSRAKEMGGVLDISWDNGVLIILDVHFL